MDVEIHRSHDDFSTHSHHRHDPQTNNVALLPAERRHRQTQLSVLLAKVSQHEHDAFSRSDRYHSLQHARPQARRRGCPLAAAVARYVPCSFVSRQGLKICGTIIAFLAFTEFTLVAPMRTEQESDETFMLEVKQTPHDRVRHQLDKKANGV